MRSLYKIHKMKPLFGELSVFLSARNKKTVGTTQLVMHKQFRIC
jgi:hypothetical protein